MRTHREPGIRRDTNGRIQAYVRANGQLRFKRFPAGTSLDAVRRWRADTRVSLGLTNRAVGTLAADIEPFLRQIADRPRLVAERRQQLEWWAERLGHLRRHAIATSDVRAALADLRRTHGASTCNHYRQALFSLYKTLDGRDAPNPVREVAPFPNPAPEARGLSYDAVLRILESMSDQGRATVKGRPRVNGSAAKARCRVLAFTGMRPSELMRYRPDHLDRTTQTLVVLTGKGGRTRTIPLSRPAVEALEDLESLGAIGPFSTSSVRRAFIRAAERIGLRGVRPYDLRHSYGTALYRAGGDTRLVKDMLGHSDSRMTERYTLGHVPEAMRAATAVFEKQLADRETAPIVPGAGRKVESETPQPEPATAPADPPTASQRRRPAAARLNAG